MTFARRGPATWPARHDLLVRERLTRVARPGVGDEGDATDLEADPPRRDALEHRRHPDRVATEPGQHPDLGRGLVGRAGQPDIDALLERDALGLGRRTERLAQARAPRVGEIREARTELVGVRPDERAPAGQVDVVAHDHERPGPERRVEAAGRVGQHDQPRAELLEQQDGLDDEARVVALVQVEAALEHDHRPAAEPAEQQSTGMPGSGRGRPAGQLRERDGDRILEIGCELTESRPEHDPDLRDEGRPGADRRHEGRQPGRLRGRWDRPRRIERRRRRRGRRGGG